ncbi:hypothetical protein JTE90_026245 [Oedothorax gibbosus]|uniref:BHLH domain-containing protein n=1 Tax=Oedothorax gibbosus TaxID=931172 RepID=A0AAV6U6U9_9ARAC|nr:hypothetical protein JTE90_026245 [Oedothorax gibbosus]
MPWVSFVSRSTSAEAVFPKLAIYPTRELTQAEIDQIEDSFFMTEEWRNVPCTPQDVKIEKDFSPNEVILAPESPDLLDLDEIPYEPYVLTDEIIKSVIKNDVMIPDAARMYPELSDGISKSNYLPDFIYNGIEDYFDFSEFDNLLHSDSSSLDQDLYTSCLDDDIYQSTLNDDDYIYNLHEEPYQEKLNAAAIEAAAFKSSQNLISPELRHIVNPNEIFQHHFQGKPEVVKIEVTDDVMVNNSPKDGKIYEYVYIRKEDEVHNDHSYFKEEDKDVVVKNEIKEEPMSEDEYGYGYQVPVAHNVVKVEAPPVVKRPVGRPRKVPVATKPIKRSSDHFITDDNSEEFVDVESIEVKRPRKSRAKSASKRLTYPKQRKTLLTQFQEFDPFNPNGYVMRQAKTSAIKKITKTTKQTTQGAARSKRSDHNDMERRRRHEMRDLFEHLKKLVPIELLVDDNNKIKKNPSKNTILNGSTRYVEILHENKMERNTLVKQNQKLLKKHRRLAKGLRKHYRNIAPRRYVC